MTRAEYMALKPGDVVRHRRTRRLRVVCAFGYVESRRRPTARQNRHLSPSMPLLKVGHSWTDPRPCAFYDCFVLLSEYDVTGRRGLSHRVAWAAYTWTTTAVFQRFRGR